MIRDRPFELFISDFFTQQPPLTDYDIDPRSTQESLYLGVLFFLEEPLERYMPRYDGPQAPVRPPGNSLAKSSQMT